MKFLGIGSLELILILIIAILVLGPDGMLKSARKVGQIIRDVKKSGIWQALIGSKESINKISQELVTETGIKEVRDEIAELNVIRDRRMAEIPIEEILQQEEGKEIS